MSSATFYKWRSKYGDASLMARLKALEDDNRRLKKMSAQERLKSALTPCQRRLLAKAAADQQGISIRLACEAYGISETPSQVIE